MSKVTIFRCPVCDTIRSHTDEVVQQLSADGISANVRDGNKGEFRIQVDGKTVIDHSGQSLPEPEHCVQAVEQATGAGVFVP